MVFSSVAMILGTAYFAYAVNNFGILLEFLFKKERKFTYKNEKIII